MGVSVLVWEGSEGFCPCLPFARLRCDISVGSFLSTSSGVNPSVRFPRPSDVWDHVAVPAAILDVQRAVSVHFLSLRVRGLTRTSMGTALHPSPAFPSLDPRPDGPPCDRDSGPPGDMPPEEPDPSLSLTVRPLAAAAGRGGLC